MLFIHGFIRLSTDMLAPNIWVYASGGQVLQAVWTSYYFLRGYISRNRSSFAHYIPDKQCGFSETQGDFGFTR